MAETMKTEILVLSDNIENSNLQSEWGLSLLVKFNNRKILVDAGASSLFLENVNKLDETIEDVEYAVLSHAHYDHANGMPAFFENNNKAKLYVRDGTDDDCYSRLWIFKRYIGIPKGMMNEYPDRIEKVDGNYKLYDGAYLIPHSTNNLSLIGKRERMYRKTADGWIPDDFSHEQSLVLDTDKGLLIINSCSHGGVVNIINEIKQVFPDRKIYGYIGGFHLFNKTEKEINNVADRLKETDLDYICTGHCTKEKAYSILKQHLGNKLEQLHTGLKIEI